MSIREVVKSCLIVVASLTSLLSVAVLLHSGSAGDALPLFVSGVLAATAAGILELAGLSS